MKFSFILSLALLFFACNSDKKELVFENVLTTNPNVNFLNLNTNSIKGQIKPFEVNGKVYLSYRLTHKYDTSSNSKLDNLLFLGMPIDYSNYSDNYDTLYKLVYDETKLKSDSLKKIIEKQPKKKIKKPGGKVYDSDGMVMLATKENTELALMYPSLTDTNSLKDYANTILMRRKVSIQQKTFPIYYHNPHFKTRAPGFAVIYKIKFFDGDNFELISYQTDRLSVKPFFDNTLDEKIEVSYKDLAKFRKDIYSKTRKIVVTILSADQNN